MSENSIPFRGRSLSRTCPVLRTITQRSMGFVCTMSEADRRKVKQSCCLQASRKAGLPGIR